MSVQHCVQRGRSNFTGAVRCDAL